MAEGGYCSADLEVDTFEITDLQQSLEKETDDMACTSSAELTAGTTNEAHDDNTMQKFLQKSQCERLYELRNLQHGAKPVTSQGHKEMINKFFRKKQTAQEQAASHGKENVPVNEDNVEEHRPETIVVEIQGLVEQQRVSTSLGTNFRRHLENIIRGSISTVARNHTPRSFSSRQSSSSPSPAPSPREEATPQPEQVPQVVPVPSPLVTAPTSVDRSRSNTLSSNNSSSTHSSTPPEPEAIPQDPEVRAPIPQTYQRILGYDSEDRHHEDMVQEISELVHSRIVTSTLEGDFRTRLEISMQERVASSGFDGSRVQEFVQNINQSQPIERNDFSNLGINVNVPADNWDAISVTSVSAHAVPYTQSSRYMSREIQSLKAQLMEMKNMMKLSFDLQMDIQRSIRQEVAAAMNDVKRADGNTALPVAAKSKPVNDTHCLICLDNHSDSVLYQCGHMCVCYTCGRNLMERESKCPVCRAPIKDIIKAYKCNED
ncbi:uncharacterized protein LOC110464106 [Mizuhopecten yessoensis]|uniref:E3 ubiquitin-protein ligase NEURL1B n=1 Tax=Mizuhopecten yessoensis TaxID=6573 RepID=A0A210PUL8_MIZYE|nr:uncharacterized protein LOC110464106 [Mizuhopecten yessoensis]OWF40190.1 E3 ubiquitin-protein ligase NEURL1B [Mizuhopecten yessoensis]